MEPKIRNPVARAGAHRAPKNVCFGWQDAPENRDDLRAFQARRLLARYPVSFPTAVIIAELAYTAGRFA